MNSQAIALGKTYPPINRINAMFNYTFFMTFNIAITFLVFFIAPSNANPISQKTPITLYLSADFTGAIASGNSIKQGLTTALAEIDNRFGGHPVKLKILDHRGNTTRAKKHLNQYFLA